MSISGQLRQEWLHFLDGHWQREIPHAEGTYPTCDYTGGGFGQGVVYKHPASGVYCSVSQHGGWWWSVPRPDMPGAIPF